MSDSICARCIATRSVSLNVIIKGLHIFGVDQIGPLALRELAAREGSPQAVAQRITNMAEMGISIGSTIFARLVEKFSSEGQSELLEDLINSDQHPDELKNKNLQKALLREYMRKGDSRQVRKTLAILTAFDPSARRREQHLLLEGHLSLQNIEAATQVLNEMHEAGIPVDASAVDAVLRKQKSPYTWRRVPVRLRAQGKRNLLAVNFLLSTLRSGVTLPHQTWRSIVYRLGRAKELDELEKIVYWLALYYGAGKEGESRYALTPVRLAAAAPSRGMDAITDGGERRSRHRVQSADALHCIFSPRVQKQLIVWGLQSAMDAVAHVPANGKDSLTSGPRKHAVMAERKWTYGFRLLRLLADHGVNVDGAMLGEFYLRQLVVLNETAMSSDGLTFTKHLTDRQLNLIIHDVQKAWGQELFRKSQGTRRPP